MQAHDTVDRLDLEVRFVDKTDGVFEGHAAVFGELNAHGEIVQPGAFTRTIADHAKRGANPPMLWAHDQSSPIGVWESLSEDATGLAVRGRLVLDTRQGAEAYALLKAKALTGLSIGFRARKSHKGAGGSKMLDDIDLGEISLVALPSADGARIASVRSIPDGLDEFQDAARAFTASLKTA